MADSSEKAGKLGGYKAGKQLGREAQKLPGEILYRGLLRGISRCVHSSQLHHFIILFELSCVMNVQLFNS